jgi:hypothetical protein
MKSPILIAHAARSGSSLTAGVLHACGASYHKDMDARYGNSKGYFESGSLLNAFQAVHDIAQQLHFSAYTKQRKRVELSNWAKNFNELAKRLSGLNIDGPWLFKHPQLLDMIHLDSFFKSEAFDDGAQWVIVRRNSDDIIHSSYEGKRQAIIDFHRAVDECREGEYSGSSSDLKLLHSIYNKFGHMSDDALYDCVVRTVCYSEKRIAKLKDFLSPQQYYEIWPMDGLNDPELKTFKDLVEWCGLRWSEDKVREFIDPSLVHYRSEPVFM